MKDIDRLLKDCGLFVNDGLHYTMEPEKILLNTTAFGNPGGDHQRHGASDTDKAGEEEGCRVAASKRPETGERSPNSKSTENEIGACGLQGTETECGRDGKGQTKER